jgi:hypothetical protein
MSDPGTTDLTDLTVPSAQTLRVFKRLRRNEMATIKHDLHTFPSVDVYELTYFEAVTSADEITGPSGVQFLVYHTSDRSARFRDAEGNVARISVEAPNEPWYIPFEEALRMAGVEYSDDTTLGDVVTDFWSALFSPPSDMFDEVAWGVSPWLERNVGDRRTVGELRPNRGGEWDDLRFRFRPRKTLNWPTVTFGGGGPILTVDEVGVIKEFITTHHQEAQNIVLAARATDPQNLIERTHHLVLRHQRDEEELLSMFVARLGGEAGGQSATAVPGAPPGVEVLQLDLTTVGLRLLDGGPDEVGVMVLVRP